MTDATRRDFLKTTAAGLAAAGLGTHGFAEDKAAANGSAALPQRPLGKTGRQVSIIGLGGYHIGTLAEKESIALTHEAIDLGINFFDNAWDYHQGGSEDLMGKALATGGRRDKVFLMTKCCDRDYAGAKKNLEDSLRRLQTDHLDLWQFHEINYPEDPDWLFERGAIKAAVEAKQAGKVRHIGFTGQKNPKLHLALLAKDFPWETVQMPINILDAHYESFQNQVVPECNRRGIGVIGMKALAGGALVGQVGLDASRCRRYALSLPISVLVCGIQSRENLHQDIAVARNFKPMTAEEMEAFRAGTLAPGKEGRYEAFKSTRGYDGRYHREQHGV